MSKTADATIFAGGAPVSRKLGNSLRRDRFTLALDGAADLARAQGWRPDLIAGDFDGVKASTLRAFAKQGVPILETPDQNHTDLEKALAWCVLRGFRSIWIAQALGSRFDHSFVALALLRRFHDPNREIRIFRDGEGISFLRDQKITLRGKAGRRLALLPFPRCRATSRGLEFEMRGLDLELGIRESAANGARAKEVRLQVEGDALLVEGMGSLYPKQHSSRP